MTLRILSGTFWKKNCLGRNVQKIFVEIQESEFGFDLARATFNSNSTNCVIVLFDDVTRLVLDLYPCFSIGIVT